MQASLPRAVPLFALALLAVPAAFADSPSPKRALPLDPNPIELVEPVVEVGGSRLSRSSSGITWIRVHPPGGSPCPPVSASGFGQTEEHVWCFEGPGGDSTWPVNPGEDWDHWSRFDPPGGSLSRWHVTTRHGGASTGSYNAWVGCDSLGTNPACADVSSWLFREGYGDRWNYPLVLDCAGQDASAGGTIEFDLRYDVECNFDYVYLEYLNQTTAAWQVVVDSAGAHAVFNAVSGVPDVAHGGTGRSCGGDIFGHSDEIDSQPVYGNSIWLENVMFPLPAQSGDTKLRWRAKSDRAWSDSDGSGDTDGMGAIDNLTVTFAADGAVVSDDFETGDFNGVVASLGTAAWQPGGLEGPAYDGWHLTYDPDYPNQGNTCTFTDDWMWSAKDDPIPAWANGFDFLLVSPAIDVSGWTGGVVQYDAYQNENGRADHPNLLVRTWDTGAAAWSPWNDFDLFFPIGGGFWIFDRTEDLTPYLGPGVDSLQVAWELVDLSEPGDNQWGKHGGVKYYVDHVSFGRFDATVTTFVARVIDVFVDTFSRSDPSHTPFLVNDQQGMWEGIGLPGYDRAFASSESLTVNIADPDGVTAANVLLWWRTNGGAWQSKPMDLAIPDPFNPGWGDYRMIVGKDDGGVEDMTAAGDGLIWAAGTTMDYYVAVTDDATNVATFPASAPGDPFRIRVLPSDLSGEKCLLVDDFGQASLDFEASTGFDPNGGVGFGGFVEPVFTESTLLIRNALDDLGLQYDQYVVGGAGSSVESEPRGRAEPSRGLGGYLDELGNPAYDCLIWSLGWTFTGSFSDSTRLDLAAYLDAGGHLFVGGDNVAFHLGAGGNGTDPGFLQKYLGATFPVSTDGVTEERILNVRGRSGGSLDGVTLGLYGECPLRRGFDRLTLATPDPGSANAVLLEYAAGGAGDDGRPSLILNERTANGGTAALAAFGVGALISGEARECVLGTVLGSDFGLTIPNPPACTNSGVDVPAGSPSRTFRFEIAGANPFRDRTTIRFAIPRRGPVSVVVYDVAGRQVRSLVHETLNADVHVLEWDGRGDDGENAASGIYFVRMTAGDFRESRKAVLLR